MAKFEVPLTKIVHGTAVIEAENETHAIDLITSRDTGNASLQDPEVMKKIKSVIWEENPFVAVGSPR